MTAQPMTEEQARDHPHEPDGYGGKVYLCTADRPWPGGKSPARSVVRHMDADEVHEQEDGWPSGDIVTYQCPHCGTRWRSELPQ